MTTSSSDSKILKFVKADESKEQHLRRAAKVATDAELEMVWISAKEIENEDLAQDRSVYILDPFEGNHFEHLKKNKCRICGPQCVLSCMETQSPLPNSTFPIYSVSMCGVFACCTSIPRKERQRLHDYVHMMGGIVMKDFTDAVTHLIAGEVGSQKYSVACSLNKPVMLPNWVYTLWEDGKVKHVNATDSAYDKYRCPIFKGCTICVTGLDSQTRQSVKRLCTKNGGIYSGELNMNTCTHLLVNLPKGEKYEFARRWNIHCVSTLWFDDCIKSGFWLEESSYQSLPEDEQSMSQAGSRLCTNLTANFSAGLGNTKLSSTRLDKSTTKAAQAAYKSAKSRGDGGLIVDVNRQRKGLDASRVNSTVVSAPNQNKNNSNLDEIDLDSTLIQGSMFLDGCKILLSGFSGTRLDKLRKIINSGGGTRFNVINEIVSHVVIGSRVSKDVQTLKDSEFQPHVVTVDWIIDSAKSGRKLPEEDYIHSEFKVDPEETPPSCKENKEPGRGNKESASTKEKKDAQSLKNTHIQQKVYDDEDDEDNVFLQYMTKDSTAVSKAPPSEPKEEVQADAPAEEDEDVTLDDDGAGLLSGRSFYIQHFAEDQVHHLQQLIEEHGGKVVIQCSGDEMADYCVLPMNVRPSSVYARQLISFCWLEKCLQDGELVDPDSSFLFRPFIIPEGIQPLEKCVITVSQYTGVERDHMMQLAELLGAQCQEHFVRKANARHKASTHLICRDPEGSKYNAAEKWKIPATTCNWLFACAKTGTLVPFEQFPVVRSNTALVSPQKIDIDSDTHKETCQNVDININKDMSVKDHSPEASPLKQASHSNEVQQISHKIPSFPVLSKAFRPSFDLTDAVEELASPLVQSLGRRKSRLSRNSFPLDDFFQENIMQAIQRTGNPLGQGLNVKDQGTRAEVGVHQYVPPDEEGVLLGVVLGVSKKLNQQQTELYGIASSLGADYRWLFDESCTHLIHQGRANDTTKEYTMAKDRGMFIVSPHWLHTCAQEGRHVEESMYPHTYNPKLSLSVVTSGRRLTRSSKSTAAEELNQSEMKRPSEKELEPKIGSDASSEHSRASRDVSQQSEGTEEDGPVNAEGDVDAARLQGADEGGDFQKQLEDFMVATKATKGRRRSRRQNSCSGNGPGVNSTSNTASGGDGNNRLSLSTRRASSRLRGRNYMGDRSGNGKGNTHHSTDESEQSQVDTITYDDPAGRLEREKIMAQLLKGCSPSPSPDMDVPDDDDDDEHYEDVKDNDGMYNDKSKDQTSTSDQSKTGESSNLGAQLTLLGVSKDDEPPPSPNTQTPVAPPVAFQVKEVEKPEPQNLLEEPSQSPDEPPKPDIYMFQLSAMTPQEKTDYSALVEQLGGQVFDTMYFKPECTHVVVGKPNRNEKYLAAMAAGKWILHKSYLEASREAGHFLPEGPHEWGVDVPGEPQNKLAMAARRWRIKLAQLRKNSTEPSEATGAFTGWSVFLCVDKSRQPGFKRLLEAGCASVVSSRPPYTHTEGVTHAFVDSNKMKSGTLDIAALHSAGILMVKPDYIAEFLMQDPAPNPGKFLIPEAAKLSHSNMNASQQRKRKGDDLAADEKRQRLE